MPQYQIVEDKWEELSVSVPDGAWNDQQLPIAVTRETAHIFRTTAGEIYHKYRLSDQGDMAAFLNVLQYYLTNSTDDLDPASVKGRLLYYLDLCLAKLSGIRKEVTILEIGSTIGENFMLATRLIKEKGYDLTLEFVGLELSGNKTNLAKLVNKFAPNYTGLTGDASDLSRFPAQSFDLVINHGVANHTHHPSLAFSEIVRVARIAVINAFQVTNKEKPFYLTYARGMTTFVPTHDFLNNIWRRYAPIYDYTMERFFWTELFLSGSGSEQFLGVQVKDLDCFYEYHLLTRLPIFPELNEICTPIL